MADSDLMQLAYAKESTFGTSPTGINYQILRYTGESLKQDTASTTSKEMRGDAQVSDVIRQNIGASGDTNHEFSYTTFDTLLASAIRSAGWSSAVTVTVANVTVANAGATTTFTRAAGSWISDGMLINQWVKTSVFVNAANNAVFKIVTVTATVLTVVTLGTTVAEVLAAGGTFSMGAQITNGITKDSYSLEAQFTDLSTDFRVHPGSTIESFKFDVNTDGIVTLGFSWMGKLEQSFTARRGTGFDAATTTSVMNAVDNVLVSVLGTTAGFTDTEMTKFSLAVNTNLRPNRRIGLLGLKRIGYGKVVATGSYEGYYSDPTVMAQYLAFTPTGMAFTFKDDVGNRYVIELVKVKLISGSRNATAENTDVMQPIGFTAMRHATEGITVRIVRWPGP